MWDDRGVARGEAVALINRLKLAFVMGELHKPPLDVL
jgi:hypothetical protein